jgi:hypothetical protein
MGRKKVVPIEVPMITPKERERVRAEMDRRIEEASRNGVYERILALEGKVDWVTPYEELRDKSDDRD